MSPLIYSLTCRRPSCHVKPTLASPSLSVPASLALRKQIRINVVANGNDCWNQCLIRFQRWVDSLSLHILMSVKGREAGAGRGEARRMLSGSDGAGLSSTLLAWVLLIQSLGSYRRLAFVGYFPSKITLKSPHLILPLFLHITTTDS